MTKTTSQNAASKLITPPEIDENVLQIQKKKKQKKNYMSSEKQQGLSAYT